MGWVELALDVERGRGVRGSVDGPKGRMNYPDGFVSKDGQWLHFAFDDNRHRAVHYSAKLPPLK